MSNLVYPQQKLSFSTDEILLVGLARNEMVLLLPSFLRHYCQLGVDQFLMVDNDSTDGTTEFLFAQADVVLFKTAGSYSKADSGHDWIRELLGLFTGNWCIVADCDEYFIYPGCERLSLSALGRQLDGHHETAICSFLLDMYTDREFATNFLKPEQHPLEVCAFHDPLPERDMSPADVLPGMAPFLWKGSMRKRVFELNFCLHKITFFKNLHDTHSIQGAYYIDGATLSHVPAVTLHFKYMQDSRQYAAAAASRGAHFNNGAEYKAYNNKLESAPGLSAFFDGSRKLSSVDGFFKDNGHFHYVAAGPEFAIAPAMLDELAEARSALVGNAVRASLTEWGCELKEHLKLNNARTVCRVATPWQGRGGAELGIEAVDGSADMITVHHEAIDPNSLLRHLANIAQALGIANPTFDRARRVLLNMAKPVSMAPAPVPARNTNARRLMGRRDGGSAACCSVRCSRRSDLPGLELRRHLC